MLWTSEQLHGRADVPLSQFTTLSKNLFSSVKRSTQRCQEVRIDMKLKSNSPRPSRMTHHDDQSTCTLDSMHARSTDATG